MQNKDLNELDIHVMYRNLVQNQDEVQELLKSVKKTEKPPLDPLALMDERKHKYSVESSKGKETQTLKMELMKMTCRLMKKSRNSEKQWLCCPMQSTTINTSECDIIKQKK